MKPALLLLPMLLWLLTALPLAAQRTTGYVEGPATPAFACVEEDCERLALLPAGAGVSVIGQVEGRKINNSTRWYEVLLHCPCFDFKRRTLHSVPDTRIEGPDALQWNQMQPIWSPDSKRIATVVAAGLFVWDAKSGERLVHEPVGLSHLTRTLAWSPDGTRIVASSSGPLSYEDQAQGDPRHNLLILDNSGNTLLPLTGHSGAVFQLDWSPDSTRIAAAGEDLHIWDARQGKLLLDIGAPASDAAWSPDGQYIASAELNAEQEPFVLSLRDAVTGRLLASSGSVKNLHMFKVTWAPDGTRIISLALHTPRQNDRRFRITGSSLLTWDGSERNPPETFFETDDAFTDMDWSPDGRFLVFPLRGGVSILQLYRVYGSDETFSRTVASLLPEKNLPKRGFGTGDEYFIERVAWSPDGQRIVATGISMGKTLDETRMSALVWDLTLTSTEPTRAFIHGHAFVDFE